jgi:hypothetical protein
MTTTDWLAKYNEYEHERWLQQFERVVDKMSEPITVKDGEKRPNYLSIIPGINYWVHVPKQPASITEDIKRVVGDAMPPGYNNIAYRLPWGEWGLKYSCY